MVFYNSTDATDLGNQQMKKLQFKYNLQEKQRCKTNVESV